MSARNEYKEFMRMSLSWYVRKLVLFTKSRRCSPLHIKFIGNVAKFKTKVQAKFNHHLQKHSNLNHSNIYKYSKQTSQFVGLKNVYKKIKRYALCSRVK